VFVLRSCTDLLAVGRPPLRQDDVLHGQFRLFLQLFSLEQLFLLQFRSHFALLFEDHPLEVDDLSRVFLDLRTHFHEELVVLVELGGVHDHVQVLANEVPAQQALADDRLHLLVPYHLLGLQAEVHEPQPETLNRTGSLVQLPFLRLPDLAQQVLPESPLDHDCLSEHEFQLARF